jgi:hypothetical protein
MPSKEDHYSARSNYVPSFSSVNENMKGAIVRVFPAVQGRGDGINQINHASSVRVLYSALLSALHIGIILDGGY